MITLDRCCVYVDGYCSMKEPTDTLYLSGDKYDHVWLDKNESVIVKKGSVISITQTAVGVKFKRRYQCVCKTEDVLDGVCVLSGKALRHTANMLSSLGRTYSLMGTDASSISDMDYKKKFLMRDVDDVTFCTCDGICGNLNIRRILEFIVPSMDKDSRRVSIYRFPPRITKEHMLTMLRTTDGYKEYTWHVDKKGVQTSFNRYYTPPKRSCIKDGEYKCCSLHEVKHCVFFMNGLEYSIITPSI